MLQVRLILMFVMGVMPALTLGAADRPEGSKSALPRIPALWADADNLPDDNSLCILCHLYFDDEPITSDHAAAGISCAHCHGLSEGHMHDETMMTSPDVLWGRAEVEAMCRVCHQPHRNPRAVEGFREKWGGKKRENGRSINNESICTDCHGLHTIARR